MTRRTRRPAVGSAVVLLIILATAPAQAQDAPPPGDTPPPPADAPPPPADPPAPAPGDAAPASDADEEAAIAAELAQIQAAQQAEGAAGASGAPAAAPASSGAEGGASSRGLSNLMNPAMSANGLILAGGTTRHHGDATEARGELTSGIAIQEVEIVASAIVDPFFRADVTLAGNADELGFEEAYLTTLELPRLTLRLGQMHAAFGRHNILHTHAYPFITAPQPWRALLGPEGLVDPGVSADVLLPLPFYAEINAQAFAGQWAPFAGEVLDDPATPFDDARPDRRRDEDLAYLGHLKTLFDLSDSSTLELGGTYVGGRNGFGGWSHVVGGDLTVKWRPLEAERYRGLDWTTEVLWVKKGDDPFASRGAGGGYTAVRAQFAQRFWLQARGSVLGVPRASSSTPRTFRGEALVAFIPSEFSALRLQYGLEKTGGQRLVHEVFAQAIFSIGPHPSHGY